MIAQASELLQRMENKNKTPCSLDQAVDSINQIIADPKYNIAERIGLKDIVVWDTYISDTHSWGGNLSRIIHDYLMPKVSSKIFYHYCSAKVANEILATRELHMYNLRKRFKEKDHSEYKLFYEANKYYGYRQSQVVFGVKIDANDLIDNIFYTSFSDSNNLPNLWHCFAEKRKGVCLKFEIENTGCEFRKIQYSNKMRYGKHIPIDIIDRIRRFTRSVNRDFIFKKISTIGSYYLWCKYKKQREYRLLVNGYGEKASAVKSYKRTDETGTYLAIPIDANPFFNIKCTEIILGRRVNKSSARQFGSFGIPIRFEKSKSESI